MTHTTFRWIVVLAILCGGPLAATAQPVDGTCTIQFMSQDSLAPSTLFFPFPMNQEQIPVTIDAAAGEIRFDFGALPVLEFVNRFSGDSLDTLDFQDGEIIGTIDAGGNVRLPGVRAINCTQGTCPNGPPCPCIPGNLCSNDVTRVCLDGVTGDLSCPPVPPSEEDGVCQGVCSNDRTQTCASTADCTPPGYCGEGVGMRLEATLTTGTPTFEGFTVVGSVHGAFVDGSITLTSVHSTPPETFGIGDVGVSSLWFTCTLDPVPTDEGMPPAAWTLKKGNVKLGKGEPGAGDDKLSLQGTFLPTGGTADFATNDLLITVAAPLKQVVTLTVPAGSLVPNGKGTKFKLVDKEGTIVTTMPPPPEVAPSHKIGVKKSKTGAYTLSVASKNLNLDDLDVATITTGVEFAEQTPSAQSPVKDKGSKRKF